MQVALNEARKCPVVERAYSVGAVIVDADGVEVSRGYSRETDPKVHAEEAALEKIDIAEFRNVLAGATIYSTLEPCSERASRPKSCSQLILESGIGRVVSAWREPSLFVADAQGVERLRAAGVDVVELPEFEVEARAINSHLSI